MVMGTTKALPPLPSELGITPVTASQKDTEAMADHIIENDGALASLTTERDEALEALTQTRAELKQAQDAITAERIRAVDKTDELTRQCTALREQISAMETAYAASHAEYSKAWDDRELQHATAMQLAQSGIASPVGTVGPSPMTAAAIAVARVQGAPAKLADAPAGKTYALVPIQASGRQYSPGDAIDRSIVWDGVLVPGLHFENRAEG